MSYPRHRMSSAWFYGVIAGLSARLGWNTVGTRVGVLVLAYFMPFKVVIAYLLAVWLFPTDWRAR